MADLEVRNKLKLIEHGKALNKRKGGAIGRPRTAQPRRVVRAVLETDELRLLEAKPIGALPMAEHVKALPPFQRLSLAQQCEINYAKQQPRVTRAVINRRDKLVHTENVLNWRVEIWRKGETRGTDKPLFFFRTECLVLGASGGQNRRSKSEFDTPHECLKFARWKAGEREKLWRGRGRYASPLPTKKRRRWRGGYIAPSKTDTKLIDVITSCECPVGEATCPVCRKQVERNAYAVRSHLRPHVRKGLLQSAQADEILSFLVVQHCDSGLIGHCLTDDSFRDRGISVRA